MNYIGIICLVLVGVIQALEGLALEKRNDNKINKSEILSFDFEDAKNNINLNFRQSQQNKMQPELESLPYEVEKISAAQTHLQQILTEFSSNQNQSFFDLGEKLSKQLQNIFEAIKDELKQASEKTVQTPMSINQTGFDEHFNWLSRSTYADCNEALTENQQENGVYILKLKTAGLKPFGVYCKFDDDKAWTIIQRRQDGSVDFYRNWTEYQNGFGNLNGEYWLGLDRIHALTSKGKNELWLEMETFKGEKRTFRYGKFFVGGKSDDYTLKVGGYKEESSLDDKLGYNNGQKFTTFDSLYNHCVLSRKSAWWHGDCTYW